MQAAVEQALAAVDQGSKLTVYGDFDVDGVSATAILVNVVRELGGDCDWFIPDRISEGYGLSDEAIARIAARGTKLVITVDCGVTAVRQVALAKELGMGIIVTDHHRPGPELPDCTILHPRISDYPFEHLCGAAVAAKFASALRSARGLDPLLDRRDLDLVAMATVADVMPLTGENRRLVREGVAVARHAERPGLRALMAQCRVEPSRLAAGDFGFRLGPRINAAGRMYRADAGVELFLADSAVRAAEISEELNRANSERRRVEAEVESSARAARRDLEGSTPCSLVLAGEGWHSGVVGIVAAKMVREFGLPTVVISIDGEFARGSGRSVPGLDLHAVLDECSGLLEGFGGHAAAAGLQIKPGRIDEFRSAFETAVVARLGSEPTALPVPIDAFTGGDEIGLDLAEDLERLEPCGKENPTPALLIPSAKIEDIREMGEGRHCRFTVVSGSARARGICFGRTGFGVDEQTPVDLLAELSVNHWNGSVEPQLQVIRTFPSPARDESPLPVCGPGEWWTRFESVFSDPECLSVARKAAPGGVVDTFDCPPEVAMAELLSSGEPVLVVTADARRRGASLGGAAGLDRFSGPGRGPARVIWSGSPVEEIDSFREAIAGGNGLCDYASLAVSDGSWRPGGTVLLFDPPADPDQREMAGALAGNVVRATDPASIEFAVSASADRHDLTAHLRALYRALRDQRADSGGLHQLLSGDPVLPHSPETAALLLRILVEAGAVQSEGSGDARRAGVVSSVKVELESSPVFRDQSKTHKEQIAFLRQSKS
jgi:single-stranded-DNA-specific exonuclease